MNSLQGVRGGQLDRQPDGGKMGARESCWAGDATGFNSNEPTAYSLTAWPTISQSIDRSFLQYFKNMDPPIMRL